MVSYIEVPKMCQKCICSFLNQNKPTSEINIAVVKKLREMGMGPQYGWPGHRNEYFYPTEDEVYDYEDWLISLRDYG